MSKNKINFTVKVNDEELQLAVVKPNAAVHQESQRVWNKTLNQALASGAMLAKKRDDLIKAEGIWNDDKEKEYNNMLKHISELEAKLKKGGITKDQGRRLALEIRTLRLEAREFRSQRNYLDSAVAESQADSERFNYFIYACTLYNDGDRAGEKYFDSFEEYKESESPVATEAGLKLLELMYDIDSNSEMKNIENQFLLKYGYCDDEGRLLDSKGRFISTDGKLLDREGFYILEDGRRCNVNGEVIDAEVKLGEFNE